MGIFCLGLAVRDELGECLNVGGLTNSSNSIGVPGSIRLFGGGIGVILCASVLGDNGGVEACGD